VIKGGYGVGTGAGRRLGVFTALIPMLAIPGVLLLLYAVVPFSFISCHSCLLKFKSLCRLEQQPWSSCSFSLRSRPTYHGPCQAQNCIFHAPGTTALMPPFSLPFSSSPPWYSSPLILLFPQSSFGFSADSHLSVIPIPLSPHIYRPSSGPPNACPSAGIPVPVLHEPEHRPPLMTKSPSSLF
jgi:hypothetical protein